MKISFSRYEFSRFSVLCSFHPPTSGRSVLAYGVWRKSDFLIGVLFGSMCSSKSFVTSLVHLRRNRFPSGDSTEDSRGEFLVHPDYKRLVS